MDTDISTDYSGKIEDATIAHGPWVSGGGNSAASDIYKNAFALKKDADGNWVVNCQAVRLIGDIPARVYTGSSLRYGWGELENFKNVSDEATVSVQVQVYDSADSADPPVLKSSAKSADSQSLEMVFSSASVVSAAAAGVALLAAMMF